MRFTKLHIDGYGRFVDKGLEFGLGLQLIAGPNEHGKSTLRSYISDMLYGQKTGAIKKTYEESNELRTPWVGTDDYRGRLVYLLDNGDEIEVHRNFDAKSESLTLYNKSQGQDISHQYPLLRNGESTFAEAHLNMTKSVFLGTATISHLSLSGLGDKEALTRIRARLLSLTDSGDESNSAEHAIRRLNARIESIGLKTSRTKPLPMTRARLLELQLEHQQVYDARQEIMVIEKQYAEVIEEIGVLLNQRSGLEFELSQTRQSEYKLAYRKALDLNNALKEATSASAGTIASGTLDTDSPEHVVQLDARLISVTEQVSRSEATIAQLQEQLDDAYGELSSKGESVMKEASHEHETRLTEMEAELQGLSYRIDETKELNARCQAGYMHATSELKELPDFSHFAPDPMERISQSTANFEAACRMRDEEVAQLEHVQETLDQRNEQLENDEKLFGDTNSFAQKLRENDSKTTDNEDMLSDLYMDATELKHIIEDRETRKPGLYIATLGWGIILTVILVVTQVTKNPSLYYVAGIAALLFLLFGLLSIIARRRIDRDIYRLTSVESDIERYELAVKTDSAAFDAVREATNCESLREIEAYYEKFSESCRERDRIREHLEYQTERSEESKAHAQELYTELVVMFAEIGESLEDEDEVAALALKSIGRYHEYRDTKRRSIENRDALNRYILELEELEERQQAVKTEERNLAIEVRRFMRENHYPEEGQHESVLKALRGYRIRSAQARHGQGDIDVIQGQLRILHQQADQERQNRDLIEDELHEYFTKAGVDSLDEYLGRLDEIEGQERAKEEGDKLREQLKEILGDESMDSLKEKAGTLESATGKTPRSAAAVQSDLDANQELLESKRKRSHSLQLLMTERSAGLRTLNEVDEERDATVQRLAQLELESQAAHHAVQALEDVTRKRYSQVAPRLAELASKHLNEITEGAYTELLIGQDMQISVRIPQTQSLNPDPERMLSKGTVDQIYLSLRLAMIQTMSEDAERIPMVLDDPFVHYDDARLNGAMKLMTEVGKSNQVLLFTCREDVVRAAESLDIPILRL